MPDLPAGAVVGIVAGGGVVPQHLRQHLKARGQAVRLVALRGEADIADADATHGIGDVEGILRTLQDLSVTHACMIGWVRRRPKLGEARVGWRALRTALPLLRALPKGDDAMLRAAVDAVETAGVRVIGIHELWPELVASGGAAGRVVPSKAEREGVELGVAAARELGRFDVGQGVVVVGRRIVAVEGLEGTDRMIERVATLRAEGAIRQAGGVLVKVTKPKQELRTDLPSVGPHTVRAAVDAGLRGVAVEAGRSLLIERERTIELADRHGLFVWGIEV